MEKVLTEVAKFKSSFEASLAHNRLEEAGIEASLTGQATSHALSYLANVGIGLLVARTDVPRAKKLLADVRSDSQDDRTLQDNDDDEFDEDALAAADALRRAGLSAVIGVVVGIPFSIYAVWLLVRYRLLSNDAPGGNRKAVWILVLAMIGLAIGAFTIAAVFFDTTVW